MKAFPHPNVVEDTGTQYQNTPASSGMDLRDYFAALIAPNMNWEGSYAKEWEKEASDNLRAKRVYEIADAMMEARKK